VNDPGPELDRLIERKLNGDAKKKTPPYSTSEKAANRLLRRLEMQDMPCSLEEIDGVWYCTFWVVFADRRERLSTGSGETRALAIARAVMNARLGMGASLSASAPDVTSRMLWTQGTGTSSPESAAKCAGCGVSLPTRNREAANRFCTVCSWRAGKQMIASGGREQASRPPSGSSIPVVRGSEEN
ncbi:MAG TPA: hypothetical protein VIZ58_07955, partial [Thermoanaerobaculia bacterium]